MEFANLTGYATEHAVVMDNEGHETLLVAVKATFTLDGGAPRLADKQDPVVRADEYWGDPTKSSVRRAAEMALFKPAADAVLTGCAYSLRGRRTETQVVLQVAGLTKTVRVVGDRVWGGPLGTSISSPEPFTRIPLVYERAFGGKDSTSKQPEEWPENPVGVGLRGKGSQLPATGSPLPNLEHPKQPMSSLGDRPRSCAFGPIAPSWRPRRDYAGTYDDHWRRDRMPFCPRDFDVRYEHPAPPDQLLPGYLVGGEQVRIAGVWPDTDVQAFLLPVFRPELVVRIGMERETPPLRCDTMVIDAEARRLWLVARGSVGIPGKFARVRWIKVQETVHA